ncbi:hypothetical protein QZH41_007355, partial [Actinostola sp. cb2023]
GREIDPEYNPSETSAKDLNKRAKYHEHVIQAFWRRWQQEYLTGLREQHSKLHRSPGNAATVNIGDVGSYAIYGRQGFGDCCRDFANYQNYGIALVIANSVHCCRDFANYQDYGVALVIANFVHK